MSANTSESGATVLAQEGDLCLHYLYKTIFEYSPCASTEKHVRKGEKAPVRIRASDFQISSREPHIWDYLISPPPVAKLELHIQHLYESELDQILGVIDSSRESLQKVEIYIPFISVEDVAGLHHLLDCNFSLPDFPASLVFHSMPQIICILQALHWCSQVSSLKVHVEIAECEDPAHFTHLLEALKVLVTIGSSLERLDTEISYARQQTLNFLPALEALRTAASESSTLLEYRVEE